LYAYSFRIQKKGRPLSTTIRQLKGEVKKKPEREASHTGWERDISSEEIKV